MTGERGITGSMLKELRTRHLNMTQEVLATRLGVDRGTLIRWERLFDAPLPSGGQTAVFLLAREMAKTRELMELKMPNRTYKNYLDRGRLGQAYDTIAGYLPRFNVSVREPNEIDRQALVRVPRARPDRLPTERYIWLASDHVIAGREVPDERLVEVVQELLRQQVDGLGIRAGTVLPLVDGLAAVVFNERKSMMVVMISSTEEGADLFEHYMETNHPNYERMVNMMPVDKEPGEGSV